MVDGEREEFERTLAELFAGIDKPLGEHAREAFWKGLTNMALIEFNRCAALLLREQADHEGPPKRFSLNDIWQAKKRLRATAPQYVHQRDMSDGWEGDAWDAEANKHLLAHIMRTLAVSPRRYGDQPSKGFAANVARLVVAKNAWAADMRDIESNGAHGVPEKLQRRCWDDLVGHAERAIAQQAAA